MLFPLPAVTSSLNSISRQSIVGNPNSLGLPFVYRSVNQHSDTLLSTPQRADSPLAMETAIPAHRKPAIASRSVFCCAASYRQNFFSQVTKRNNDVTLNSQTEFPDDSSCRSIKPACHAQRALADDLRAFWPFGCGCRSVVERRMHRGTTVRCRCGGCKDCDVRSTQGNPPPSCEHSRLRTARRLRAI